MFCDFKKSHGEFLVKYTMILTGNQSIIIKVKIYKLKENVFQNKEHCYLREKGHINLQIVIEKLTTIYILRILNLNSK